MQFKIKTVVSKFSKIDLLMFGFFLLFSWLLMSKTFKLDPQGNLQIATKVWSDFAANIPLTRSFSFGSNFPPEYPIFAGPPIRYHFVFYFAVAILEKVGLSLPLALNLLSAFTFTFLLTAIYILGKTIFNSVAVGVLSIILFLLNSSLSFLEFFKAFPLSAKTLTDIITNTAFPSFGPYDGKIVSSFWNLNIYTNQRHLALGYASFLILFLILTLASKKPKSLTLGRAVLVGVLVGLFPFVHMAVFGMIGLLLIFFFLTIPKIRGRVFIIGTVALLLAIPQVIYMGPSMVQTGLINPGYLVEKPLTLQSFTSYWILNLGFLIPLSTLGWLHAKKSQKKIILPFLMLFVLGNIFQLSPEIAANHKFFNLFVIGANFYAASLLIKIWGKNIFGKLLFVPLLVFMTLSGFIDIFPIANDTYVTVQDVKNSQVAGYIASNTPKDSVFLNSTYLYNPASLAGRKIYMGWPYFAWSAGYDTNTRFSKLRTIFLGQSKQNVCRLLTQEGIDYIEIQSLNTIEGVLINNLFFENSFEKIYTSPDATTKIYNVAISCAYATKQRSRPNF